MRGGRRRDRLPAAGQISLSGTILMKSGVTLRLDNGCTLLGSTSLNDYPADGAGLRSYTDNYTDKSLIYGEKLRADRHHRPGRDRRPGSGVQGALQGAAVPDPAHRVPRRCRRGRHDLKNSPMWVQHYLACDDVRISGITVDSHVNQNNDGIDIDSCHRVVDHRLQHRLRRRRHRAQEHARRGCARTWWSAPASCEARAMPSRWARNRTAASRIS